MRKVNNIKYPLDIKFAIRNSVRKKTNPLVHKRKIEKYSSK